MFRITAQASVVKGFSPTQSSALANSATLFRVPLGPANPAVEAPRKPMVVTGTHNGEVPGIAPVRKSTSSAGVAMIRVADGWIDEIWSQPDTFGLLQQIGAIKL